METTITNIQKMVEAIIDGSNLFLTDIKIKPTNNIKIFIDGDSGITIEAVSKINRTLYKQIEEGAMFPDGDFSLEVSSPGVDEPLKFVRQYNKNIGRKLEITLLNNNVITGTLEAITETEIKLTELIGKKKETKVHEIPFAEISKAVVQISF